LKCPLVGDAQFAEDETGQLAPLTFGALTKQLPSGWRDRRRYLGVPLGRLVSQHPGLGTSNP